MADHNTLTRLIRQLKRAFGQEDASVGMQAGRWSGAAPARERSRCC